MKKLTFGDPETMSPDLAATNLERLKALFPELVTEGPEGTAVNVDVLKALVGDKTVSDADEKYGLNWHGKRQARQLALTPSTGTLRPCPEESLDWDTTQNLMIEGDNLEVLKLLQKSYVGKVNLIFIDPPYNTGNDFVYADNFQDSIKNYLDLSRQTDDGARISSNMETDGRFHTNWLNMMYPRLKIARDLLCDEGVMFITIDNTELDNLLATLKELMGPENYATTFIWEKRRTRENRKAFSVNHDYIACVAKNRSSFEAIRGMLPLTEEALNRYRNPDNDPRGVWQSVPITAQAGHGTDSQFYTISTPSGREITPPAGNCWRFTQERLEELVKDGRIWFGEEGGNVPRQKMFLSEQEDGSQGLTPHTLWTSDEVGTTDLAKRDLMTLFDGEAVFGTPKPVSLIQRIVQIAGGAESVVLDFFAGSGTTGEAVLRQNCLDSGNRRYLLVQLPEPIEQRNSDQRAAADFCDKTGRPRTIAELTKERLRRAAQRLKDEHPELVGDLGFRVFKLDSSNIRRWEPEPNNLEQTILDYTNHIKDERTELDILYELLLKLGLDLCVPIEQKEIAGKAVHSIGGGVLMACLAQEINRENVEPLAQGFITWHQALAPAGDTTCVFRDSAFTDDVAKTNLTAILNQHGITTVRSL